MNKLGPLSIGAILVYLVGAQFFLGAFPMTPLMGALVFGIGLFIFVALAHAIEEAIRNRRGRD